MKVNEKLKWLILGNHCPYCGKLIGEKEELCEDCRENLPEIIGAKCSFCGAGKDRCGCKKHKMKYDGISAPFYYEGGVSECIRRLKFRRKSFAAEILAENMAKAVKEDFAGIDFDVITYIPFSVNQTLNRPYNQSELLAEALSKRLNIPCDSILEKLYDNKIQHETKGTGRRGNVFGIYDVKKPETVQDKTVLLVDDIKTTGNTLNQCAVILKIRGAKAVYCSVAAITPAKKEKKPEKEKTE